MGEKLAQKWGQPVIVDNKVGASGNIGMAEGARAAPDGYTLVLAPAGNLTVNPALFFGGSISQKDFLPPITVHVVGLVLSQGELAGLSRATLYSCGDSLALDPPRNSRTVPGSRATIRAR